MVLRDFPTANLTATGGSTFTNISRPVGSTVLAIWALAPGANELAHKANAPKQMRAVSVVRFAILPQEKLCNDDTTSLLRYDPRVRGSPTVSSNTRRRPETDSSC